jgi:metal-responsive CopG/Arc/MetJ family transcriptional regulator
MEPKARICITLDPPLLRDVDDLAGREERSRSQVIARAIRSTISQIGAAVSPVAEASGGVPVHRPASKQ